MPRLVTWALTAETNVSSAGREKQREEDTKRLGMRALSPMVACKAGKPALWGMSHFRLSSYREDSNPERLEGWPWGP